MAIYSRSAIAPAALAGFLILALACSSGGGEAPVAQSTAESAARPDEIVLLKGPLSPDGLQAIFATPDLGVGTNRVAFVVTSRTGLVRDPAASVTSLYFANDSFAGEKKETALAVFRPWPHSTRGSYSTELEFDRAGRWGLDISILDPTGPSRLVQLAFDVPESPAAPAVGAPAVASRNKTVADVDDLSELTTGSLRDPELYQTTVAEGVKSGLPTVVVMASPAFCTNAVCGPQVEVLRALKDKYAGQANFIHVDFYDNPDEIQGDLDRAEISPTVLEWNLPSSEWSFVIDRKGTVAARFESFATLEEIERALLDLL